MKAAVLSLCDRTGVMVRPWLDAGHDAYTVDTQHDGITREDMPSGATWHRIGTSVTDWLPPRTDYAAAFAFPPCTNLAVSGARWFEAKGLGGLADGLRIVEKCAQILDWAGAPWMLENPVSTISSYWRKPDHLFDPWEFGGYVGGEGDGYTKRTCLWTGGGFVMPEPRPIALAEDHDRIHKASPGDRRGDIRSITPPGFARAVYEANTQAHAKRTA